MSAYPEGPFFVAPVESKNAGNDFLALGAVGERLVATALPGITNVTRYLRAYTVAGWIVWCFNEHLKALSAAKKTLPAHERALFKAFREKGELMFSWCNKGTVGAIGNSRTYPESNQPLVLSFDNEQFGVVNQASWFAAAAYGPSFSKRNGLGYIAAFKSVYVPTTLGEKAARVLDDLMSQHPAAHGRIADLTNQEASLRDVKALEQALSIHATTAKERTLFRDAFFPVAKVGVWDTNHGNRATTIALILQTLKVAGPLNVEDIRQSIALGITPAGDEMADTSLQRVRRLWFVLSLRQLERVALERLLRWLERELFNLLYQWCDVDTLCQNLAETIESTWPLYLSMNVGQVIDGLQESIRQAGGISRAALGDARLSQFKLRRELESLTDSQHGGVPAKAIYALLLCTAAVGLCEDDAGLIEMLKMGLQERISLISLVRFARSRSKSPISEFAKDVLTHLVYAQHLKTAAARVEEGKNKFRFAEDDTGLRPLISSTSINAQLGTPDRILHALYLMDECRLVRQDAESNYELM